ncbi:MAG: hypothetical protein K8R76_02650 [Candidatus Aegiribacteria sp.]|nr:hypothetical protein [Candidatus Aegiribacteria sp.]
MTEELRFNVKDIPLCAKYGFSARKIWVYFKTLILSWIIWDIFIYLGFFAAGYDMAARWEQSRLFPLPGALFWKEVIPVAFLIIAAILILYVLIRGGLKVSRMTFQQIRGDNFFSGADASRFARGNSFPLIAIPVLLVLVILLALAAGAASGVLSRIPVAGPILSALLAVPLWGVMLLAVLTALALVLSFQLLPSIIATTGADTFESVFELFSTMTSQSWRVFLYWLLSLIIIMLGGITFFLFASLAVDLLSFSVTLGAGSGGFGAALASGPRLLAPEALPFFSGLTTFGQQDSIQTWTGISGVIAGLSGTAIFLVVVSYFLSCCSSSWTLIYLVLRYKKDGVDLADRADLKEQREFDRLYGNTDGDNQSSGSTGDSED